jgi:hypothetical protein
MDSKLILKLDVSIIEQAKIYAKENNISLSKLFENYLKVISNKKTKKIKISPLVESLTGVISLKENFGYKKDYSNYLTQKYK